MAYEKIGWKDYPDKTTPMSAKNFAHMEDGIFENSVAIGEISKIAKIGDGTCTGAIVECFQSVSDGKAAVATALTNQGVATASDATFATMASNVTTAGNARYNSGYSTGVTAADNRANANSVNYKTGYNNGYNAGVASVSLSSQAQTLNAQLNPYSNTVYTTTFSFPHGIAGVTACYAINAKTGAAFNNGTFCPVAYSISGNTISVTVYNNTAETWYTTDNIRLVVQVNGY